MTSRVLLLAAAFTHLAAFVFGLDVIVTVWGEKISLFFSDHRALLYVGGTLLTNALLMLAAIFYAWRGGLGLGYLLAAEFCYLLATAIFLKVDYVVTSFLAFALVAYVWWRQKRYKRKVDSNPNRTTA